MGCVCVCDPIAWHSFPCVRDRASRRHVFLNQEHVCAREENTKSKKRRKMNKTKRSYFTSSCRSFLSLPLCPCSIAGFFERIILKQVHSGSASVPHVLNIFNNRLSRRHIVLPSPATHHCQVSIWFATQSLDTVFKIAQSGTGLWARASCKQEHDVQWWKFRIFAS